MTVSVYRKKPVEVKALLWDGRKETLLEIHKLMTRSSGILGSDIYARQEDGALFIPTLEGVMQAYKGDYIIQGVKGELYPCKPDIFKATYEKVA
ncbi:MAG: hypothetical protein WCR96_05540 [Candidatus Methanomethylophilaceae archaeon]